MNGSLLFKNRSRHHHFTLPAAFQPFAHRNFLIFWLGAFVSSNGFWIRTVGQGWQVLQLTNSPFLLGVVTFAATLPSIIFTLFGGIIVDRLNRRYVLIGNQALFFVLAALLGVLTTIEVINVWQIIIIALIYGTVNSLGMPAWNLFISDLLPAKDLKQGIALNAMQFNMSRVIGPALGGISIAAFGLAGSYYLNALCCFGVMLPLIFMRLQPQKKVENNNNIWQNLQEGLQYTFQDKALQLLLFLQFVIAFFVFPYATLLPVFANDVFQIGAEGLGGLNAATGVGALVGSITLVLLNRRIHQGTGPLKFINLIGGITCILFGLSTNLTLSFVLLMLLGACTVFSMTLTNTMIQTMAPEEIRGRVLSIWITLTIGVAPIGNLFAGLVAQSIGAAQTLMIGGIICAIVAGVVMLISLRTRVTPMVTVERVVQTQTTERLIQR